MKDSELTARWPSERMRLLATAAFHADADIARHAWQSWEENADFDDTPFAELRLFPVMARRLTELGLDARDFPRVKGVRRFMWAKSLAVLDAASPLVDALRKAGIPLVVLKGGARHLSPDLKGQERFISDLDILLPRSRFLDGLELAETIGWHHTWTASREWIDRHFLSSRHSIGFSRDGKNEVDLHAFALLANRCFDIDDGIWARARPAKLGSSDVLIPCPTDQLLMACVHGQGHDPVGVCDWIADAVMLVAGGHVDWSVFLEEVERRDLAVFAHAALHFLTEQLAQPIPKEVVDKTGSDCAEPFIGEYLGMGQEWDATTRVTRASWGAAAMARARRWIARQDRNGAEVGQAACGDWVRVRRSDKARCAYRVAVPAWARDVRGPCILDIEIGSHLSFASGPFDMVLTCFGSHRAEFATRAVESSSRMGWLAGGVTASVAVDAAILGAYALPEIEIQLLSPGSLEPAPIAIRAFRVRWRTRAVAAAS